MIFPSDFLQQEFRSVIHLITGSSVQEKHLTALKTLSRLIIQRLDSAIANRNVPGYFKSKRFYADVRTQSNRMDSIEVLIDTMSAIELQGCGRSRT